MPDRNLTFLKFKLVRESNGGFGSLEGFPFLLFISSFILIFASIDLWLPQPIKCFLFLNLYCFQFIFPFFQFLVLCSADVGSEGGSGCLILRQRPNCLLSRPSSHFVAIWPSGSLISSYKIVTKIVVQICTTHSQMFQKVESVGGLIFKVVLEC